MQKSLVVCLSLVFTISSAAGGNTPPSGGQLSAAEIVEKNVTARGGLQAWRGVQTMSMEGKLGAGGNRRAAVQVPSPANGSLKGVVAPRPTDEVQLPFVMKLKRPGKMRIELQFNGKTALQVYDGYNGWKLRPFLNRLEAEPYTAEEAKISSMQAELDGYLIDYAAKGTQIELAGTEKVEDRDTYKLKLNMENGQAMHVWIDAQTFLEAKIEGQPRRLDGTPHPVEVYYRDYRLVNGLQIPFILETKVLPVAHTTMGKDVPAPPEKIIFENVVVNPKLDDSLFAKPETAVASKAK